MKYRSVCIFAVLILIVTAALFLVTSVNAQCGGYIQPAEVMTREATDTTPDSANLRGNLTSLGAYAGADVYFVWGLKDQSFPNQTASQYLTSTGQFSTDLDNLDAYTMYQFMVVVDAGGCIAYGDVKTFYTDYPPSVQADPASGPPNGSITISGSNFPSCLSNGTAGVTYGSVGHFEPVTAMGAITTDGGGEFIVSGTIPWQATGGAHGLIVYFNADQPAAIPYDPLSPDIVVAMGLLIVEGRELNVVPNQGPLGTQVTVSGGGLYVPGTANYTASISVDGSLWYQMGSGGIVNLDASGDIIPDIAPAVNTDNLFAVGANVILAAHNGGDIYASGAFEVTRPAFELDLTQGPRGTLVICTGSGWLPGVANHAYIEMVRGEDTQIVGISVPDENGEIRTSINIPSDIVIAGANVNVFFRARDENGNISLLVPFTVTRPSIDVEPASGAPGSQITVTGEGFLPQAPVTSVQIFGANLVRVDDLPLTDTTGGFQVTGVIPGLAAGGYAVTAIVDGYVVTASFTVLYSGYENPEVSEGFTTIDGLYTRVWSHDPTTQEWIVYETTPVPPWVTQFDTLVRGYGYWVEVTQDCILTYGPNHYNLYNGWNLVGWLGLHYTGSSTSPLPESLTTIDGLYTKAWTYDAAVQQWQVYDPGPSSPDDFTDMNRGQGYWMEVTQDCVLTYGAYNYNLFLGWNLFGWLG